MPRTETIQLYRISELPENVQSKVLDKYRCINTEDSWYDDVISNFEAESRAVGFDDIKVRFSGFYSQGDGASFTGSFNGRERNFDADNSDFAWGDDLNKLVEFTSYSFLIESIDHMYAHENTVTISDLMKWEKNEWVDTTDAEDPVYAELTKILRSIMQSLYRELEHEYEGLTSDESVIDALENTGHEFLEDGTFYDINDDWDED